MLGRSNVWSLGAAAVLVCVVDAGASAQPDPRQMSGIPRPDPNLSDGSITVRVIRGSFANNVVDHPVDLLAGAAVSPAVPDAAGRASFRPVLTSLWQWHSRAPRRGAEGGP